MNRLVKLNNVDLNKISVFCQIVESGNYRLASEVLNVTPSALSQTVTNLEHALGEPLFHRVGKRLLPTQKGLKLHREFRRSHVQFMRAIQNFADDRERVSGLLRIGAYLEFAKFQLTPVIKAFLRDHSEAQVKLVFDSPSRLNRLLENDRIDLCFSIFPSVESRTIESRPAFHEELVLIAPGDLFSERPSYNELIAAPIVEYYFNHQPLKKWLYLHFKKRPKNLPIRAYAASAEMVLALVEEGVGIGIVPKFLLEANKKKNVRVIRPSARQFLDHIWVLEKKSAAKSPIHLAFHKKINLMSRP